MPVAMSPTFDRGPESRLFMSGCRAKYSLMLIDSCLGLFIMLLGYIAAAESYETESNVNPLTPTVAIWVQL